MSIMRERRKTDPSQYHFIHRGNVLSKERFVLAPSSEPPNDDPGSATSSIIGIATEQVSGEVDQLSDDDVNVSDSNTMASFFNGLLHKSKRTPRNASYEC